MTGKRLMFSNGEVRDACGHTNVLDRPGANPVCVDCGDVLSDEDDEDAEP
jgi:hypothetical protein